MALIRPIPTHESGFVEGSVTMSSTQQTKITLGFKPRYFCLFITSSTTSAGALIYDESDPNFSSTRVFRAGMVSGTASGNLANIPNTENNTINSIDNDGVTLGAITAYGTTGHYVALK